MNFNNKRKMSEFILDKKLIEEFEASRSNVDGNTHFCYLLTCPNSKRCYIGYTTDPQRRLRQHNGDIKGGAKKTSRYENWDIVCTIGGFENYRQALRFEWKWQHIKLKFYKDIVFTTKSNKTKYFSYIKKLYYTIQSGDHDLNWPELTINWHVTPIEMN